MISSDLDRLLWAPKRVAWLVGILVIAAAACGSGDAEPTDVTTASPVSNTPTVSSGENDPLDTIESKTGALDRAPAAFIAPSLAAFDDGLLAWGSTTSGDGALTVIDVEASGWFQVRGIDDFPTCGSAVELGDGVALIGNVESGPPIGLLIDIKSRNAEPFDVPEALQGDCPAAVATDGGLLLWSTKPAVENPVVVFTFDAITGIWNQLPPPPFPADTYEAGGVWTGEKFIMLGSTEGQPSFVGASIELGKTTWDRIPDAPVATWEHPHPIWSGNELIITSSWPNLITGGEVDPFPEPLAPGGSYNPVTDTWQANALAPNWTEGLPVWTGEVIIWWQPGDEHATVYDPQQKRWWNIAAPTSALPEPNHDTNWAGTWAGTQIVATDGSDLFAWTPDLDNVVELDPGGKPRTDEPVNSATAAGTRTGALGLLGQACGFIGRNSITVTVTEESDFSLDYAIDREEPCGSIIVHEGAMTGTVDVDSRQLVGQGNATVDGRPATVTCVCEITSDNRVVGELVVNGEPKFIVAFVEG